LFTNTSPDTKCQMNVMLMTDLFCERDHCCQQWTLISDQPSCIDVSYIQYILDIQPGLRFVS